MQVLIHLPLLRVEVANAYEMLEKGKPPEGAHKLLLYGLGKWMHECSKVSDGTLDLRDLMDLIGSINIQYRQLEQQDAQEFMMWIFNQLSDELKKCALENVQKLNP